MRFFCDRCGLCCKHIDQIPELKKFDSGNGRCENLTDENLCAIYEKRPIICNVSKMFELVYSSWMTEEDYWKLNFEGCKKLKGDAFKM